MADSRRVKVSFSVVLLIIVGATLALSFSALSAIGKTMITSYFRDEADEKMSQQVRNLSTNAEAVLDSMRLTLSQLVSDEAFRGAAAQLSGGIEKYTDYVITTRVVNEALDRAASSSFYGFDVALVCSGGIYPYKSAESLIQLDFDGISDLYEAALAKYQDADVVCVNPPDALSLDPLIEGANYIANRVSMLMPVQGTEPGARAFLLVSVEAERLLHGAENMALVETSAGAIVADSRGGSATTRSVDIPKYPYRLLYADKPEITSEDYARLRLLLLLTVLASVVIALPVALTIRKRVAREVRFMLDELSAYGANGIGHAGRAAPMARKARLRRLVVLLLFCAVVLPTLGYCAGFYASAERILTNRGRALIDERLEGVAASANEYFLRKNHIARVIKYIPPVQDALMDASSIDRELIRDRVAAISAQNISNDFVYIYNARGELIVSNAAFPGEEGRDIGAFLAGERYPRYRYEAATVRGRADARVVVRNDPISSINASNYFDLIGFLRLEINESELSGLCARAIGNLNCVLSIVNADGWIISSTNRWLVGERLSAPNANEVESVFPLDEMNGSLVARFDASLYGANARLAVRSTLERVAMLLLMLYMAAFGLCFTLLRRFDALADEMHAYVPNAPKSPRAHSRLSEVERLYSAFYAMTQRIDNLVDEVYMQELNRASARLQALRAQVKPHFLNNILETAGWLIRLGELDKARKLLLDLGKFYRYQVNEELRAVPLSEELHCVECYCRLQDNLYEGRVTLQIDVDERLRDIQIPCFLLQPLVENAYKHGFRRAGGGGTLRISGTLSDGLATLSVADNGAGLTRAQIDELLRVIYEPGAGDTAHVGVQNVAERLMLYYGRKRASMRIDGNKGGGLIVRLVFPIAKE